MITNTSKQSPLVMLVAAMGSGGMGGAIESQERHGQAELVQSSAIPTDGSTGDNEVALLAMGFTLGPINPNDKMFRECTLPAGWKKRGSDHAMWSYIDDDQGRERLSIFYKAAFYDRSAHMRLSCRYTTAMKYATGPEVDSITDDYDAATHRICCVTDAGGKILHAETGYAHRDYTAQDVAFKAVDKWLIETYPDHRNPAAYW